MCVCVCVIRWNKNSQRLNKLTPVIRQQAAPMIWYFILFKKTYRFFSSYQRFGVVCCKLLQSPFSPRRVKKRKISWIYSRKYQSARRHIPKDSNHRKHVICVNLQSHYEGKFARNVAITGEKRKLYRIYRENPNESYHKTILARIGEKQNRHFEKCVVTMNWTTQLMTGFKPVLLLTRR